MFSPSHRGVVHHVPRGTIKANMAITLMEKSAADKKISGQINGDFE